MSAPEPQSDKSVVKRKARLPWLATLIALLAFVIMLRLGFWQIQRASEKQQRLEQIDLRSGFEALTIDEVAVMKGDVSDFLLQATGYFDSQKYFLLDNRVLNQKVGYEVLVPLTTGSHSLLVNLGWVPAPVSRDEVPVVNLPNEELRLYGMLSVPKSNPFVSQTEIRTDNGPSRVQEIDLVLFSEMLGKDLLPFVMQLSPEHEIGYERNWKPVVMSPQKHWAYAIQWFGLALACVIIFAVAINKRIKWGRYKDE